MQMQYDNGTKIIKNYISKKQAPDVVYKTEYY